MIAFLPVASSLPSAALNADPLIRILSPGNLYDVNNSLFAPTRSTNSLSFDQSCLKTQ